MRPSRHQMFMAMARAAAMRATCYRLNVGAVLVRDQNVVAIGYNGAPSGRPHCTGSGCQYYDESGCTVIHAETNALRRYRESLHEAAPPRSLALYVTHSPCLGCASELSDETDVVGDVFYETAYRDPTPIKYLRQGGVRVWQLLPSGMLVDTATGGLVERP